MGRVKIVIGNIDIDSDGSAESAKVVHDIVTGLLNIAFDEETPEPPKRKYIRKGKQIIPPSD